MRVKLKLNLLHKETGSGCKHFLGEIKAVVKFIYLFGKPNYFKKLLKMRL
jgi:hypothetical protein